MFKQLTENEEDWIYHSMKAFNIQHIATKGIILYLMDYCSG